MGIFFVAKVKLSEIMGGCVPPKLPEYLHIILGQVGNTSFFCEAAGEAHFRTWGARRRGFCVILRFSDCSAYSLHRHDGKRRGAIAEKWFKWWNSQWLPT